MNELINFDHNEFGRIRALSVDQNPWFVGIDVASALGYVNTRGALIDHCKRAKNVGSSETLPLDPQTKIIPESDVYRLIFRSKLPSAEKFQDWVCEDVLPSIRKQGFYHNGMSEAFQHKKSQHFNLAVSQLCSMTSPKIRARLALRTLAHYTGIPVDDFMEEQEMFEAFPEKKKGSVINRFLSESCVFGEDLTVNATDLYKAFVRWDGAGVYGKISQKEFGAFLTGMYKKEKRGGKYRYYGLSLNQE